MTEKEMMMEVADLMIQYPNKGTVEDYIGAYILAKVIPERERRLAQVVEEHSKKRRQVVDDSEEIKPRKKREKREKDDSKQTLDLMLNFNKAKPAIPSFVSIDELGDCSEPIRKQLTKTDVDESQVRLRLGKEQVEKMMVRAMGKSSKEVMGESVLKVPVYGQNKKKVHEMMLKLWNKDIPVLTSSGWNEFVKHYGLKEHSDFVTIWMFSHKKTGELCFAIDYTRFDTIEQPLSHRIFKDAFKNWD